MSDDSLRLAELLCGLSVIADLGMGLEPGEATRAALVAVALANEIGTPESRDVYYTTLLQHIGCTAYAHEAAGLLGGDEIAVTAALFHRLGGPEAAQTALLKRAGRMLDPTLVDIVRRRDGRVLHVLDTPDSVSAAIAIEPEPLVCVLGADLARVCRAFGDVVDVKSPFHHGHAAGVAELVTDRGAAVRLARD